MPLFQSIEKKIMKEEGFEGELNNDGFQIEETHGLSS